MRNVARNPVFQAVSSLQSEDETVRCQGFCCIYGKSTREQKDDKHPFPSSQRRGGRAVGADGVARSASPIGRSLNKRSASPIGRSLNTRTASPIGRSLNNITPKRLGRTDY